MIRLCQPLDFETMYRIVNDAAEAYRGVIPADCWKEPYMPREELAHEIQAGVVFYGFVADRILLGIMGLQAIQDVTLIRHAYVAAAHQGQGIGGRLLAHLRLQRRESLMLVGTWAAAGWAVRFYEKRGFRKVTPAEKDRLLRTYWVIPERQIETSVVLADARWFALRTAGPDRSAG